MKKRLLCAVLAVLASLLFSSLSYAGESLPSDIAAIAAEYEPGPHPFVSDRERNLLTPGNVTPERFMEEIAACEEPEDVTAYLRSLGANFDLYDGEYVYFYRHNKTLDRYPLDENIFGYAEIITVTYSYAEDQNDNRVFIFAQKDGSITLIDSISGFGEVQIVTDQKGKHIWLVGKTGSDHQTIRWYHVQSGKTVLAYLAHGINPDRMDYHVKAETIIDPTLNQAFPSDGVLTLLKQISVIDLTHYNQPGDETPEIVLYTQALVYEVQKNGDFLLMAAETFPDLNLQETAEVIRHPSNHP